MQMLGEPIERDRFFKKTIFRIHTAGAALPFVNFEKGKVMVANKASSGFHQRHELSLVDKKARVARVGIEGPVRCFDTIRLYCLHLTLYK